MPRTRNPMPRYWVSPIIPSQPDGTPGRYSAAFRRKRNAERLVKALRRGRNEEVKMTRLW